MEHIATATIILQERIRDRAAGGCGGCDSGICAGGGVSMSISLQSFSSRRDIMCNGPAIVRQD
jgi:hypothetical protein